MMSSYSQADARQLVKALARIGVCGNDMSKKLLCWLSSRSSHIQRSLSLEEFPALDASIGRYDFHALHGGFVEEDVVEHVAGRVELEP